MLDQVAVALVGVLGAREAGVLAHRPEPVAVHALVDTAGERVAAGLAEPLLEARGDVGLVVERLDLDPRVGEHPRVVGPDNGGHVAVQVVLGGARLLGIDGLLVSGCRLGHGAQSTVAPRADHRS